MVYVGIDLGGTNIAVGLVDENYKIVHKGDTPTPKSSDYKEIVKEMSNLIDKLLKDIGYSKDTIKHIGVGSPGTPNIKDGTIVYSNNIKFKNAPIREEMKKYYDVPIFIENDANCAALAERYVGAAKGAKVSVTITLGTGVGSGLIIDNKVYNGFNYAASEMGHTVIVINGEQCTCGRKGCWERYASATAMINQTIVAIQNNPNSMIYKMVDGDISKVTPKIVFDAKKAGDEVATKVVEKYTLYLAEGISNIINSFMPEIVVVGGGVSKQGEYLLEPLREMVYERIYSHEDIPRTRIVVASMENDAGIVGAAMLGLQED